MEEVWVPVVRYEWSYEVSNFGKVRSLDRTVVRDDGRRERRMGRVLSPGGKIYLIVFLHRVGAAVRCVYVHRLVAEAFVPNPDRKLRVYFKDGNPQNCRADNLSWSNRKEKQNDSQG